jgi:hypothetical protein
MRESAAVVGVGRVVAAGEGRRKVRERRLPRLRSKLQRVSSGFLS